MQSPASSGKDNGQQLAPSGKDMDKLRSELAFERQCNSELGRRNRRYLKIIDKFDSHRGVMDSHIAEMSENLRKLASLLQQGMDRRQPFSFFTHLSVRLSRSFQETIPVKLRYDEIENTK